MSTTRKRFRIGSATLVIGLVTALSAACSSSGGTPSNPPATGGSTGGGNTPATMTSIKVGLLPLAEVSPIYLGVEKGFFKNHGLDVTIQQGAGGSAGATALAGGSVDFSFGSLSTVFVANEQGIPIRVVAPANSAKAGVTLAGIVVKKDSGINNVNDLAGKQVGINQLQTVDYVLDVESLKNAGATDATIKSIKWVPIGFPDMPAALEGNRVAAITAVEPFLTTVLAKGDAKMLVSTHDVNDTMNDLLTATYFTIEKYATAHPDVVKEFQAAVTESLNYAEAHQDEARAQLSKYTKMDPALIAKIGLPTWSPKILQSSWDWYNKFLVQDGVIKTPQDASKILIGDLKLSS